METILAILLAGLGVGVVILARQSRLTRRRQRDMAARLRRLESDLLRTRRALAARRAACTLRERGVEPALPIRFTAEWGEDLFLFHLLGPGPGFYIEAGAFDGVTLSVSYPFEAMGWTGLLVEPLPEHAARAGAARPRSRVVNAALGAPGGPPTVTFTSVGPTEDLTAQMLSHAGTNAEHRKLLEERHDGHRSCTVRLATLDGLLAEMGETAPVPRIDFGVFDVEGGELDLLRGFDLRRHRPRVLVIEDLTDGEDHRVRDVCLGAGYEEIGRVGRNAVFVIADEPALVARARALTSVLT
jgi:FkbM family methyltransferase